MTPIGGRTLNWALFVICYPSFDRSESLKSYVSTRGDMSCHVFGF